MKRSILIFLTLLPFISPLRAQSHWEIRLMPQAAFGAKNTVQRPNDTEGTRFSLTEEIGRKNKTIFSPRLEIEYVFRRHHIIGTVALLREKFEGPATKDIRFDRVLFGRGTDVDAVYRFNTYRIGYRYKLVDHHRFDFELGATILIRDAFIKLKNQSGHARFDNVGVAPLLSYYLEWRAKDRLSFLSYGEAFALKVGRAEDIFLGAKYYWNDWLSLTAGYRLLEGGSDGDRVYTMSAYHCLSFGVGFRF